MNIDDIIWIVLVLAMSLGSILANKSEKQKKKKAGRSASGSSSSQTSQVNQGARGSGGSPSMEELASRRREQLRELARRRREQLTGVESGRASDGGRGDTVVRPDNLSVQEAAQRERGRQAYEERARALRGGQSGKVEQRAEELSRAEQVRKQREMSRAQNRQEQLEALRRRYRERQGQASQQQSPAQRQATPQQPRRVQQAPAPAARRAPLGPSAPPPPPSMRSIHEKERSAIASKAIERGEIGVGGSRSAAPVAGPKLSSVMGGSISWRDAIVLKEILDKPVGERRTEGGGMWM